MAAERAFVLLIRRQPGEHSYSVSLDAFRAQLDVIARLGAAVLRPEDFVAGARLPSRGGILLTFDDGNQSDRTRVLPALVERGWRALFFVSPALVGTRGYASWSELRELHEQGMTIGAHGLDHTPLTTLDDAALARQMTLSQGRLLEELGRPALTLALPNGFGGPREVLAAHAAGFRVVFGSATGFLRPATEREPVARIAIRRSDDPSRFERLLRHRRLAVGRARLRQHALALARAALGDRLYERARGAALERG